MRGITIIGPGRIGGALALALATAGYRIDSLLYRTRSKATQISSKLSPRPELRTFASTARIDSPIVFITVQDGNIAQIALNLLDKITSNATVFHTSGSLSSKLLAPLREIGCRVASLHPLASVSDSETGVDRFKGAYFCLEGDKDAVKLGKRLVKAVGGTSFEIDPSTKTLYHVAALTAAGHVTALFDIAVSLMTGTGLDRRQAHKILTPLLTGAAANLARQDTVTALTGTFARADVETFARQIEALERAATKDEFLVYLELASRSLDLAETLGTNLAAIDEMRRMISLAKRSIGC